MWFGGTGGLASKADLLFVPKLKADGVIDEATFSFFLDHRSSTSYVDLGTPDPAIATEDSVVWIEVARNSRILYGEDYNNFWNSEIRGLYWQSLSGEDPNLFKLRNMAAITDTGNSCIYGPSLYIQYLRDKIASLIPQTEEGTAGSWDFYFDCALRSSLPSFFLLFGEHWFEVSPYDYAPNVNTGDRCALCLEENGDSQYWVLGQVFLRGRYSIHDYEKSRMGFAAIQSRTLGQYQKAEPVTV